MTALRVALLALALAAVPGDGRAQQATCEQFFVTGYSSAEFPGRTASGLPTHGNEWAVAAAHPRFPFGTVIVLDGIGPVTVQDRGALGYSHVDVLTFSAAEAFALTGYREGCW